VPSVLDVKEGIDKPIDLTTVLALPAHASPLNLSQYAPNLHIDLPHFKYTVGDLDESVRLRNVSLTSSEHSITVKVHTGVLA
jgi:hypothetical protein